MKTIVKSFDPQKLKPGFYASSADTDAWPLLTAMEVMGVAARTREWFEEDGRQFAMFKVGRPVADNGRMPQSARNYDTPLAHYSYWAEAWWREAIQNGVDAKATNIDCYAIKNPDGTWALGCADNGTGMSENILLHAFLTLGGTGKTEEDQGGFGKAKELLTWPWASWYIHSRGLLAVGKNDSFNVYEAKGGKWAWKRLAGPPFYDADTPDFQPPPGLEARERVGTELQVVMSEERHATAVPCLVYIEKCFTPGVSFHVRSNHPEPVDVVVKGELENGPTVRNGVIEGNMMVPVRGSTPPRTEKKWVTKAKIHYAKVYTTKPRILIRTDRGLFMYEEELRSGEKLEGYIIVELIGDPKQLLTDSRDSLRDYDVRSGLAGFRDNLSKEGFRAVKPKKTYEETTVYEGAKQRAREQTEAEANLVAAVNQVSAGVGPLEKEQEVPEEAKKMAGDILEEEYKHTQEMAGDSFNSATTRETGEVHMERKFIGADQLKSMAKQLVWKPAFILHNEEGSFRIPSKFRPEKMTPAVLRLARVWTETCRSVLIQLGYSREWGTGFVFSEDAKAQYMCEAGQEWLILNPYKSHGSDEILNPSIEADRNFIYAAAVHEATHMVDNAHEHEVTFAIALTKNISLTMPGIKKFKKLVDSIHLRGQIETDKGGALASTLAGRAKKELLKTKRARSGERPWGEANLTAHALAELQERKALDTYDRAIVFTDDSVLTWYDGDYEWLPQDALNAMGNELSGRRASTTKKEPKGGSQVFTIYVRREVASPAVVLAALEMYVAADEDFVYAEDSSTHTIFDGMVGELRKLVGKEREKPPVTGKAEIVTIEGHTAYLHATVTGEAGGMLAVDESGMAHVLWANPTEGISGMAMWNYLVDRGMNDAGEGQLLFICSPQRRSGLITIVDARSHVDPVSAHDIGEAAQTLRHGKRVAKWLAGFFRVLGGDAWHNWTWEARLNPSADRNVFYQGNGLVLKQAVEAALGGGQ